MSLLHYLEYGFVKYIANYVENNSLEKSYKTAEKIAEIAYKADKRHRDIARTNLIRSFGNEKTPKEIEALVRASFINLAYVAVEFLSIKKFDKKFIKERVDTSGIEYFKDAVKQGKGVINITGHLGNWELLGALYTSFGLDLSVIAKRQTNRMVSELVFARRNSKNINLIPVRESNRKSLKALRDNHILGMVADQDVGKNGVFVNFFGRQASTARGPAVLNRKTDSPVIMAFLVREEPGRFKLVGEKPLEFVKTDNKEEDICNNTILWSSLMEMYVRKYPEQWFWVHRRWKTQKRG